jgi:hypothetical protein
MNNIRELKRLSSPAPKPQSLAWAGSTLWMGSRETKRIYAIDPTSWTVSWETTAPGTPWGMAVVESELRVLCGETSDDSRIIRRCVPGQGFDKLHLSQWYPKKLLTLGNDGKGERVINVPHGICGQVYVDGCFYLATTDAEESTDYWLTRVDPRPEQPKIEDLVRIPFAARALAFDGKNFWTNHREQNQIVSFARPD